MLGSRPSARQMPQMMRPRGVAKIAPRLIFAAVLALVAIIGYMNKSAINPLTGQKQHISLTPDQEIQLGLQAAPQLVAQHHGVARSNPQGQAIVEQVGVNLVNAMHELHAGQQNIWPFTFTLLEDDNVINAFALPGGNTFITEALYNRLETEGQLAGVFGHEIGHVVHRHGAQRIAKQELTQGLTGAAVIAGGNQQSAQFAAMLGNLINMKYGRGDELESDMYGVEIMAKAGYDPRSMVRVMEILAESSGGARQPEFASTHPNPENRIQRIRDKIKELYPDERVLDAMVKE